jgi:hypothetical protein
MKTGLLFHDFSKNRGRLETPQLLSRELTSGLTFMVSVLENEAQNTNEFPRDSEIQ